MKIKDIFPLADFAENADFNSKILMIVKKKFAHSWQKNINICENPCNLWEKKIRAFVA